MKKPIAISFTSVSLILSSCATPPRVLSIKSQPAEANVCIKGRFGGELLSQEQQCIGLTPFESDRAEITDKDGKKRVIHFNEIQTEKESFFVVVNRKGFSSESTQVPGWEHYVVLKSEAH